MGVYDARLTKTIAEVLKALGSESAMIVHGKTSTSSTAGALDEISAMGPTQITQLKNGEITTSIIQPDDMGIEAINLEDIKANSVEESSAMVQQVLEGQTGAARVIATLNAAAALIVADFAEDLKAGYQLANQAIDNGSAKQVLDQLIAITQA